MKVLGTALFCAIALAGVAAAQNGAAPARPASDAAAAAISAPMPASVAVLLTQLEDQIAGFQTAVAAMTPDGWRASAAEKQSLDAAQAAMQRNLREAVPGLLQAYRSAPADYGAAFRLYRDLDSIVQVGISTASAAQRYAPATDAAPLQQATDGLNQALQQFGDAVQSGASAQYTAWLKLQQPQPPPASAPAPPAPQTVIINNANGAPANKKSGGGGGH